MNIAKTTASVFWLRWLEMFGKARVFAAAAVFVWILVMFFAGLTIGSTNFEELSLGNGKDPVELIIFASSASWLLWVFGPLLGLAGVDLDESRLAPYPLSKKELLISRTAGTLVDIPTLTLVPILVGLSAGMAGWSGVVASLCVAVSGIALGTVLAAAPLRVRLGVIVAAFAASLTMFLLGARPAPFVVTWMRAVVVDGKTAFILPLVLAAGVALTALLLTKPASHQRTVRYRQQHFSSNLTSAVTQTFLVSVWRSRSWRLSILAAAAGIPLVSVSLDIPTPATATSLFVVAAAATGPLNMFSYVGAASGTLIRLVPRRHLNGVLHLVAFLTLAVPALTAFLFASLFSSVEFSFPRELFQLFCVTAVVSCVATWWSWRFPDPVDHAALRARPSAAGSSLLFILVASLFATLTSLNFIGFAAATTMLVLPVSMLLSQKASRKYSALVSDRLAR